MFTVRAHMSDQRASADHPERRELVPYTRGEKIRDGVAPRTQEIIVVYQSGLL
jgi:hypothetical protein